MTRCVANVLWVWMIGISALSAADQGNRLSYLDGPINPYFVGPRHARLATPQWCGEPAARAVVVLAIDDMTDPAKYEKFLRPIVTRLQKIDGRAPVSIMTKSVDPHAPQLVAWQKEGITVEAHTADHPCPCLQRGDLVAAKGTYDRCIDQLAGLPGGPPVAFRMPCCDSMNSVSPRFFSEIFNQVTPDGNFLKLDTSVFQLITSNDPDLARNLVIDEQGRERFLKYLPSDRVMVNTIENYPYPYVIGNLCWEIPCLMPSDWDAQHFQGVCNPNTVADLKRAIDATVVKQGLFSLCFHPHGWIRNDQVVELIDYAVEKYGDQVLFLSLREVAARLEQQLTAGSSLRNDDGSDRGIRLCDVNNDGWMDVVLGGGPSERQVRLWQPATSGWKSCRFPVSLAAAPSPVDGGAGRAHFGVLQPSGEASLLVLGGRRSGLWHFQRDRWVEDGQGLHGLDEVVSAVADGAAGDDGVRLRDMDGDGICELIVANPQLQAVYAFSRDGWRKLPHAWPGGWLIVDQHGRDAGLRMEDIDEDGYLDLIASNVDAYRLCLYSPAERSWSRTIMEGSGTDPQRLPPFVRSDGSNNGVFFKDHHLWIQNEDTGGRMPDHVDRRFYTTDLLAAEPEPPARSPMSSLNSLTVRPGFRVELMAHEPLVRDPVDLAWGPDGKLWVTEMADYPLGLDDQGQPGGRVRFLEDRDGDGHYDHSTVFLDGIPFPTGVMPWRKGVLITAAPTVFYAEDSDGDGRADQRVTLFDGFHEGNQQHRVNHMRWGLDNWIHVANGDSDGLIRSLKNGTSVDMSGLDLRFRPDDGALATDSGRTQFGRNRDDWGNWFGCNNNNPGWVYRLDDRYLSRNPHVATPSVRADLTHLRDAYPLGRVMTHCFYDQPTPAEGQPGRWTSVCGLTIYRDDLFGPWFAGNAFVSDSVYNVVHRMILDYDGIEVSGRRASDEQSREFLASVDPWFRPTTVRVGPDGALWVADMYRHVIEHPQWIDDRLEKQLELRDGHQYGRLYRVLPVGVAARPVPRLDGLSTTQLVARLDSASGWQRDMVHQMLLWRGDTAAIRPLEDLIRRSRRPQTRLQALCVLDGLGKLSADHALLAVADPHPAVRRHAIRVGEPLVPSAPKLHKAILQLANDPDLSVVRQLAYSLGQWTDKASGRVLADLLLRFDDQPVIRAAAMSSAVPHVATLRAAMANQAGSDRLRQQLAKLEADIGRYREHPAPVATERRARIITQAKAITGGITRPERRAALDKFSAATRLPGDPKRGKLVFEQATCSNCHRLDGVGQELGPDIRTLLDRSPENLLVAIVDPNRAVKERFIEYQAVTAQGRVFSGLLLEQSTNSIVLATTEGNKITILRRDLEELGPTDHSFMSEGLDSNLSVQQMADLMAFVRQAGAPRRKLPGNVPKTLLSQQDKRLLLPVRHAEVFGTELKFDATSGFLSGWKTVEPYLVWSIHLHRSQTLDVWIHAGRPADIAPGAIKVETASQSLDGAPPGTSSWTDLQWSRLGRLKLEAGYHRIAVRAEPPGDHPLATLDGMALVPSGMSPAPSSSDGSDRSPAARLVKPGEDGALILSAEAAKATGPQIKYQPPFQSYGWFTSRDRLQWSVQVDRAGMYEVWLEYSVDDPNAGKPWVFFLGNQRLVGVAGRTGSWEDYRRVRIGRMELAAGVTKGEFRPGSSFAGYLMDFRKLELVPQSD